MCDDVTRIMAMVDKCKEVERAVKRPLLRCDYEAICLSVNDRQPFVVDYLVFDPPTIPTGLRDNYKEMGIEQPS